MRFVKKMMSVSHWMLSFVLFFLAGPLFASSQQSSAALPPSLAQMNQSPPVNPKLPSIFIVGDSTASFHQDMNHEGPAAAQGWGVYFPQYFDLSKVNIINASRGGRSTRTYMTEGLWEQVVSQLRPHDYVLLQLGQNDVFAINDATRARGTLPGTGDETEEIDNMLTHKHEVVHTFGWYLRQYIRETRAKGAVPIVMSLTPRNVWRDGVMERGAPDYRTWSARVAVQENAIFVDISDIMASEYEKLGQEKTAALYHGDEPVHVNTRGAALNARWVVSGLKGIPGHPFDTYLSAAGRAVLASNGAE
jgi:rhamnogalacturonan acetylesterase